MPETIKAEEIHFVYGLLGWPFFKSHAISGDKHASTIISETAVYKNSLPRITSYQRKKLSDLLIGRRRPAADGDGNETNSQRFGAPAFPLDFFPVFSAKINNRGDAEFLKFSQALFARLRATVEHFCDFSAIGDTRDMKLFAVGGLHDGRSG